MILRCGISGCENRAMGNSSFCFKHRPGTIHFTDHPEGPVFVEPDMVNHPAHYNQGKFEVLDVIEDNLKEGFEPYLVGNILKYVMRYKHKNGLQDLEKAEFYLKRLIQTKRSEQDGNETK